MFDIRANVPTNKLSEVGQAFVELSDHLFGGALLRAVDGRGTVRSGQRIGNVARDANPCTADPRIQA